MGAAENKNGGLTFFDHLAAGRVRGALDLMDEDALWRVSGNPETVTSSTAEDDRVAVETEVHGVSPNGKAYDNRNFFALEVHDGRIRSVREYFDTIHTNEVLFDTACTDAVLRGRSGSD